MKWENKQTSLCWFHFNTDVSVAAGTDTIKQTGQQRVPEEMIRGTFMNMLSISQYTSNNNLQQCFIHSKHLKHIYIESDKKLHLVT